MIGTSSITLAAQVYARSEYTLNLSPALPAEARGRELTADEQYAFGARLEACVVSVPRNAASTSSLPTKCANSSIT